MILWAIVPVKPFHIGKSRLADALDAEQRVELNKSFLTHTLTTISEVHEIEQTLVISRDPQALCLARELGARTVQENGSPGLNGALARATIFARGSMASGVLILPADLPMLTAQEIELMLQGVQQPRAGNGGRLVTIAPDRRGFGTNGLMVSPPGLIPYQFGKDSFRRHCLLARRMSAQLEVVRSAGLELDVDFPEDLEIFRSLSTAVAERGNGHPPLASQ